MNYQGQALRNQTIFNQSNRKLSKLNPITEAIKAILFFVSLMIALFFMSL